MPYYRITIWLVNRKPVCGIRYSTIATPEMALTHFWELAIRRLSRHQIKKFEVVMLAKTSGEVKDFIMKQQQKRSK